MEPRDPYLLLSYVNTKLRDVYPSLTALADDLGLDEEELKARLGEIGYVYSEERNAFC